MEGAEVFVRKDPDRKKVFPLWIPYISLLVGGHVDHKVFVRRLATSFLKEGLVNLWGRAEVRRCRKSTTEGEDRDEIIFSRA